MRLSLNDQPGRDEMKRPILGILATALALAIGVPGT